MLSHDTLELYHPVTNKHERIFSFVFYKAAFLFQVITVFACTVVELEEPDFSSTLVQPHVKWHQIASSDGTVD